ncbi:MAG TPA: mandelate racemase/muconate lactonizing enzyme family protein [Terriglobia bacterium]|nr:mandelate racemase/muconate lactonizing enzyme family protein [Terriglobia bacterium]
MGARNRHEITRVDAFPLREPISGRAYTLVRIRTKSGLTGHGECSVVSGADLEHARQVLIGRAATSYVGSVVGLPMHPAVITAMLDIIGQACAAPLYRVLGGPTRNKIRVMTSLDGSESAELEASLSSGLKAGFRAFRVRTPATGARIRGQAYVRSVRARLQALRPPAGDNVDFVLDADGRLSPGDAASLAADLEDFHLLWFDEPCPLSDLPRVRRIAETTVMPLGFGRSVNQPHTFQDLLREGILDVARPDLLRESAVDIRRIAALAETYYVAVAPHHEGGPVATATAIHLAASLPNFFIQHIPLPSSEADQSMRGELLSHPVEISSDGFAALISGPGLGIAVNERALEKYKDTES